MKQNKVDINKIDLEKERDKISETPGLIPFAHNIGGFVIKKEDHGKIKGKATAAMQEQAERQMKQLYKQMETLAKQASEIKQRVKVSEDIYNAQISFEPLIGHTYFLYEKEDGTHVLSMIGPNEWGKKSPFKSHIAQVKLMSDHTWDVQYLDLENL